MEHIIQDGGSGEDFDAWAVHHPHVSSYQEKDGGMYDAINRGFLKASGDIFGWLNCDEQYLPGALRKVANFFGSHPETDILFGDILVVDASMEPLAYRMAVPPLAGHIRRCFLPTFSAATFVRRRIIDEGIMLDTSFRAIADAVWIHQLIRRGYRTVTLNEPLAVFTQTGENLGQTTASLREAAAWREKHRFHVKIAAKFWSTLHQIRKLLAGAYRTRSIPTQIFYSIPPKIKSIVARLGGAWKSQQ